MWEDCCCSSISDTSEGIGWLKASAGRTGLSSISFWGNDLLGLLVADIDLDLRYRLLFRDFMSASCCVLAVTSDWAYRLGIAPLIHDGLSCICLLSFSSCIWPCEGPSLAVTSLDLSGDALGFLVFTIFSVCDFYSFLLWIRISCVGALPLFFEQGVVGYRELPIYREYIVCKW